MLRIAKANISPRTRFSSNSEIATVNFYANRIYYFQCTLDDLEAPRPIEVQEALEVLMTISQRIVFSGQSELFEWLEWPLFIAGIEIDDLIQREWILQHLSRLDFKDALQSIFETQGTAKRRAGVGHLRSMFRHSCCEQKNYFCQWNAL